MTLKPTPHPPALLPACRNRPSEQPLAASSSPSADVFTAREVIAEYVPALHYKFHTFEFRDIIRGVAGDGNEIRILAFLDGPAAVAPADIFCPHRCCGTDRLQGCHPVFDHGCELNGFFSVIGPSLYAAGARGINRKGDLGSGLERPLKTRLLELSYGLSRRIFVYGERKCHEDALVNYHPNCFRIDVDAEFKRVAASFNGLPHGDAGVGGAGYLHPL